MNTAPRLRTLLSTASFAPLLLLVCLVVPTKAGALDIKDLQVKPIPQAALEKVMSQASAQPETMRAYSLLIAANASISLADSYLTLAVGNWSPTVANSYNYGGITFNWKREGNHWTWSWSGNDGSGPQSFVTDVNETGSSYDIKIRVNNSTFLAGTVSQKGAAGTVTIYSNPAEESTQSFTTTWVPDSSPYTTKFTVVGKGESALGSVVLRSDDAGSQVSWSYTP